MADLKHVTYCGLHCQLCAHLARIPQQAAALQGTLRGEGWTSFGARVLPGFEVFWAALETLARLADTCAGCRGGCGDPDCAIRVCARAQGVVVCSACARFPCSRIEHLAAHYPNLVADGYRQRSVGIEAWSKEQERRRRAGFCYADIRHPS